jgi:ribose-phosphate pyrophosphokinase
MKTYCLNLDKTFDPCIDCGYYYNIEYEMIQFSGGELHIKLKNEFFNLANNFSDIETVTITQRIRNSDDLMKILIAKDALERKGIKHFNLVIPYIPYARQDRQCNEGESFTLKVFTNIINSANFEEVIVLDAHSDVAPALLNNCTNILNTRYVEEAITDINSTAGLLLISPDSGANKKINKLFDNLKCFDRIINCDKKRDLTTGKLSGFKVFATDLSKRDCIIVDDICDEGRTFIGIAEELKKLNTGNIYLFVTHGIFSNGFDELSKYFTKIYCTNSFKDIDDPIVTQFKIQL